MKIGLLYICLNEKKKHSKGSNFVYFKNKLKQKQKQK